MKEQLDPNKKTILVVDDEKPIIDILVYNLNMRTLTEIMMADSVGTNLS